MGKPVIGLVIEGILAKVGVLGRLQTVILVKKLEVQRSFVGDVSVVRVEGHLSVERPCRKC